MLDIMGGEYTETSPTLRSLMSWTRTVQYCRRHGSTSRPASVPGAFSHVLKWKWKWKWVAAEVDARLWSVMAFLCGVVLGLWGGVG